jgi:hypothetical protein
MLHEHFGEVLPTVTGWTCKGLVATQLASVSRFRAAHRPCGQVRRRSKVSPITRTATSRHVNLVNW